MWVKIAGGTITLCCNGLPKHMPSPLARNTYGDWKALLWIVAWHKSRWHLKGPHIVPAGGEHENNFQGMTLDLCWSYYLFSLVSVFETRNNKTKHSHLFQSQNSQFFWQYSGQGAQHRLQVSGSSLPEQPRAGAELCYFFQVIGERRVRRHFGAIVPGCLWKACRHCVCKNSLY